MTTFEAKVLENIPANRLLALAGVENDEDGWDKILLKPSELGWIPDFVTNNELEEGSFVNVSVRDNPVWRVESAQNLPAGTLVQCAEDGRVKDYRPEEGNHIGYTTHSVVAGEVVEIVRKYGQMSQTQTETMSFEAPQEQELKESPKEDETEEYVEEEVNLEEMTNKELDELAEKEGIELTAADKKNKETRIAAIVKAFE
jgi:hypothetical protein